MNSGLYAFAGASATATAAAWAKRLDWPMTKLSNVYFGLSRVSLREPEDAGFRRLLARRADRRRPARAPSATAPGSAP